MNTLQIDASSPVYAVIGDPVAHSIGPAMHNRALAACGLPGVYVAFRVSGAADAVAAIRTLGLRGVSVTIPHKVAVMEHLDEVDETARVVGAVNTVVLEDGRLVGTNTDGGGALDAITAVTPVAGKRVAVLGAGGAARAVAGSIARSGGRVTVYNRSPGRAAGLAEDLGLEHRPLADVTGGGIDILVNTTSVGMAPRADAMPIDPMVLDPATVVMDIVYNPVETALLAAARRIGCPTVDGVAMFVGQGARQFERWTGVPAPVDAMRAAVVEVLMGRRKTR